MSAINTQTTHLKEAIKNRRSIFPNTFTNQKIERATIEDILAQANYAPTHRLTQPWRFKVITDSKLEELGKVLATWYKDNTSPENYSERKWKKTAQKPVQSSHVIAICMQRDPKESVPEWEEIASTAMAVQNMWLATSSYGLGAYWSSPKSIQSAAVRQFLGLSEGQSCMGFFYMGHHQVPQLEAKRTPITEKVAWL